MCAPSLNVFCLQWMTCRCPATASCAAFTHWEPSRIHTLRGSATQTHIDRGKLDEYFDCLFPLCHQAEAGSRRVLGSPCGCDARGLLGTSPEWIQQLFCLHHKDAAGEGQWVDQSSFRWLPLPTFLRIPGCQIWPTGSFNLARESMRNHCWSFPPVFYQPQHTTW